MDCRIVRAGNMQQRVEWKYLGCEGCNPGYIVGGNPQHVTVRYAFCPVCATYGAVFGLAESPSVDHIRMIVEIIACRCCGKSEQRNYSDSKSSLTCGCSGFFCESTGKCATHCPLLLTDDQHSCSNNTGIYPRTFTYRYEHLEPSPPAGTPIKRNV